MSDPRVSCERGRPSMLPLRCQLGERRDPEFVWGP